MSTNGNTSYRKANTMNAPNHRLVDAVSDVYAPNPSLGDLIAWSTTNRRWESGTGFTGYFKAGSINIDATCTAWTVNPYGRTLLWGQAGSIVVLFFPTIMAATTTLNPPSTITFSAALPSYLWPVDTVVCNAKGMNLNSRTEATVVISTVGVIEIYNGTYGLYTSLTGTACGSDYIYVPYKINFAASGGGIPIPPTPPPAMRFIDLTDTQAAYITPFSLMRVKAAANGVSEFDLQATLPAANQFRLTSGTSQLTLTNTCTIDQDLATTASPQFASLTVNNKLTVTGLIDPTGLVLTKQSVNPSTDKTIWTDGTIIYYGQIPIGSNVAWWCSVDKTVQAAMKATATTTLTGAGGVGELATTVAAALDGDVIAISSNLGYSPITLPTAKRLTIRVTPGYGAYLTGANCCTLVNGCRDITIVGLGWDTCTTTDVNALGSAISLQQSAVVTRIIFAQCNLRACAGSAVMMSYHQSIGGDNYATANVYPGEFSSNIAFVDCSFNKCTTDGNEGAALSLRGVEGAYIKSCLCNCQGTGGRGIQLQNCILAWVEECYVTGGAGTLNGEGIKLDRIGAPAYYNSGYFIRNISKSNKQGIDLDDFDSAVAIGNRCFKNTAEGLCLCGVGQTTVASNTCWENNDGIAIEVAVSSYKLYNNVSFLNTTNNYRLDGGGSPNDSNLTAQTATPLGADSVPFTTSGTLVSKNVNDALNEIAAVTAATDINGFSEANRLIRTLAITDGATPKLTIAGGPYQYYQKGVLYTRTTDNVTITNVEGMHYFYYNGATLSHTTSVTQAVFRDYVFVAMCYWQADLVTPANSKHLFLGDETHAFMDWATHWLEHNTQGTQWMGGLALNGFTIGDGSINAHAIFGFDSGSILDEDLTHTISAGVAATYQYSTFYRSGASGVWRVGTPDSAPLLLFAGIGTRPTWNQYTGGAWQQTEVSDNKFFLVHIFATNAYSAAGAGNSALRMIAIMGQNEYASVALARTGANNELAALQLSGLPTVEFVAIGTVIYQTNQTYANTWKAKVVLTDTSSNYVDWRQKKALNATTAPTNHHNLSDLNTYDDHPQKTQQQTPGAVTANALVRWDGTLGEYVKNSLITVDDTGNMSGIAKLTVSGVIDPTALVLTPVTANPGGTGAANALWMDSLAADILKRDSSPVVLGPASATSTAISRWNGTDGHLLQDSLATIDAAGKLTTPSATLTSTTAIPQLSIGSSSTAFDANAYTSYACRRTSDSAACEWYIGARYAAAGSAYPDFGLVFRNSLSTADVMYLAFKRAYFVASGTDGGFGFHTESTYADSLKDEDNMASNSDHALCTQQSIKAYVDGMFATGTFNVTFTGPWAADRTVTIAYSRAGNSVTFICPESYAAATVNSTATSTTTAVPLALRPGTEQDCCVKVVGNGAVKWGTLRVKINGDLELLDLNLNFGAPNDAGFYGTSNCTYKI